MGPSAKRRKVASKIEEINFDTAARQEFLTGFRKRKLQRVRHAQEVAERKAKEIKRDERRKIREQRAAEFQRAFDEHRKQLKRLNEDSDGSGSASDEDDDEEGEEWGGIEEPPPVDYEAEYIDEDKYTTVTVEEMDPSREGLLNYHAEDRSDEEDDKDGDARGTKADAAPEPPKKKKAQDNKPKKKKKKFRYESKEERKLARTKQRLSNQKKAKARREQ